MRDDPFKNGNPEFLCFQTHCSKSSFFSVEYEEGSHCVMKDYILNMGGLPHHKREAQSFMLENPFSEIDFFLTLEYLDKSS